MTTPETYRKVLELSMPPEESDGRREWLKTAMEVIADALLTHAGGDVPFALKGLGILTTEYGAKRIAGTKHVRVLIDGGLQ